jgi:hypothetical protein
MEKERVGGVGTVRKKERKKLDKQKRIRNSEMSRVQFVIATSQVALDTQHAQSCRVMHCGNCVLAIGNRACTAQFLVGKHISRLLCHFSYLMYVTVVFFS